MKKRNSSLELLRIICMIMIVVHHYSVHGGYAPFTLADLNINVVIVQMASMFGRAACSIFAIITGYFLVSSQNIGYRRVICLLVEMIFYSWVVCIFAMITGVLSLDMAIKLIFPMFFAKQWYVNYYLIFCLIIPFLNPLLRNLDKKGFLRLLLVLTFVWCIIPTFTAYTWSFSLLDFFVVMYLVGGYIRLHADKPTYPNKKNLWIALTSGVLMLLSVLVMDLLGIITGLDRFVSGACYFREFYTPFAIIFAISMFLYFKQLRFYSHGINRIGTSMVGVYLLHTNEVISKVIWEVLSPNVNYINSSWLVFHIILKCMVVFFAGIIIDQLRLVTVDRLFQKWLDIKWPIWQCKWRYMEKRMFDIGSEN